MSAPSSFVAPAVPQRIEPSAIPHRSSLFGLLVVDLLALGIAFLGSQVSDERITGAIVMMMMIGALGGHVVVGHLRRR